MKNKSNSILKFYLFFYSKKMEIEQLITFLDIIKNNTEQIIKIFNIVSNNIDINKLIIILIILKTIKWIWFIFIVYALLWINFKIGDIRNKYENKN